MKKLSKSKRDMALSNRFSEKLEKCSFELGVHIPFTGLNTILRSLDKQGWSVLDVGCAKGKSMRYINRSKRFSTIGVDIFPPYLRECKRQGVHDDYVLCDARRLPFQRKSFDIVFCLQVLEHLEKEDGGKLIASMEKIARRELIISIPVGLYKQQAYDADPYQEHRSTWVPAELEELGYKVRGAGFRGLGGEQGLLSRLPKIFTPLQYMYILIGPLVAFFPDLAGTMICIKKLEP